MKTIEQIHNYLGIGIPAHLAAQAAPGVVTDGFWRQGDVYVRAVNRAGAAGPRVSLDRAGGWKVVEGDADRNSHIFSSFDAGCYAIPVVDKVDYGVVVVPEGASAFLTHTGEHGTVGFGPGVWRVWGQVSFEEELRRAAD